MRTINEAPKGYTIRKMNDNTYTLRREVINIIYKLNDILVANGLNKMPRVEVRICDLTPEELTNSIAMGRLNANQIWVSSYAIKTHKNHMFTIVAHECIHAVKGIMHPDGCPLMDLKLVYKSDIDKQIKAFIDYMR